MYLKMKEFKRYIKENDVHIAILMDQLEKQNLPAKNT